jgi:SAM-dependent methyltransferase
MYSEKEDRRNKEDQFKRLGWELDEQGGAIFEFLYRASREVSPADIVLDLGAGQCRYKFFFEHAKYVAADFARGDAKWDYSHLDIRADITDLSYIKDNAADFCLNTVTLEHLPEPHHFIREVARILKPGGKLFLYLPFIADEHQIPYDFFRYTSYGLKYMAEKAGLTEIKVIPTNTALISALTFTEIAISQCRITEQNRPMAKCFRKLLARGFRYLFKPGLKWLAKTGTSNFSWPICWIMEARKPGRSNLDISTADKTPLLGGGVYLPNREKPGCLHGG